jgi:hypothetical protein
MVALPFASELCARGLPHFMPVAFIENSVSLLAYPIVDSDAIEVEIGVVIYGNVEIGVVG